MNIPPHHPLQELLARLLFSIETVPAKEKRRMVSRACREAVRWHVAACSQAEVDYTATAKAERKRCAEYVRAQGTGTASLLFCRVLANELEQLPESETDGG